MNVNVFRAEPLFRAPTAPVRGTIDASNQFTVSGLTPGRYVLRAIDTPGWRLESVTSGGVDITDRVMTLENADITDIVVSYADQGVNLRGTVQNAATPDGNAIVFIFPADQRRWPFASVQTRVFGFSRARANGAFAFRPRASANISSRHRRR
jgi:hypothetical protein